MKQEVGTWRGIPEYWVPGKTDTPAATKVALDRARKYLDVAQRKGRRDRTGPHYEHYDRLVRELTTRYDTQNENAKPSTGERAYKTGMNVVAVAGGATAGHAIAENINTRHQASVVARKPGSSQLAKLSKEGLEHITDPAKASQAARQLRASARVNNRMNLSKAKGPSGLGVAAILGLEGLFSRFVLAPKMREQGNETTAEAFEATGTVAAFAATGLLGSRAIHNATLTKMPDAKNAALIEKGRMVADKHLQDVSSSRLVHADRIKRDAIKLLQMPGGMVKGRGRRAALVAGLVTMAGVSYAKTRGGETPAAPAQPFSTSPPKAPPQAQVLHGEVLPPEPARNPRRQTGKVKYTRNGKTFYRARPGQGKK